MLDPGDNTLEPPDIAIELEASFANKPKAMCIWNKLKEDEDLKALLSLFANPDRNYKLSIGLKDFSGNKRGDTYPKDLTDLALTSGEIHIDIDSDMSRSPIEIAKSIAHELIHAHIYIWITEMGGMPALIASGSTLYTNYYQSKKIFGASASPYAYKHGEAQHWYMADVYQERLAQIIRRYDNFQSANSMDAYRALAWEGLKFTRAYKSLENALPDTNKYYENLSTALKAQNSQVDTCE